MGPYPFGQQRNSTPVQKAKTEIVLRWEDAPDFEANTPKQIRCWGLGRSPPAASHMSTRLSRVCLGFGRLSDTRLSTNGPLGSPRDHHGAETSSTEGGRHWHAPAAGGQPMNDELLRVSDHGECQAPARNRHQNVLPMISIDCPSQRSISRLFHSRKPCFSLTQPP
jgi:hypothetical protein